MSKTSRDQPTNKPAPLIPAKPVTVFEKIQYDICEVMGFGEEEVTLGASFVDDFECNELDIVEIIMAAESRFDIEILDEDLDNLTTVKSLVEYVTRKVGNGNAKSKPANHEEKQKATKRRC